MVPVSKWPWRWIGGSATLVAALLGGLVVWQTSRALKVSKEELHAEREIRFTAGPFSTPQNIHFEAVRSPEVFAQAARFQDSLYVAGPAGLSQYDLRGNPLREFSAGRELPGSPLVAMAVGQPTGATQPELVLATAEQGI